jgi:hypothetical protein
VDIGVQVVIIAFGLAGSHLLRIGATRASDGGVPAAIIRRGSSAME